MSLAHDIAAALPILRAEAEARMVDSCTITRGGGAPVFDDSTGTYTDPAGTVMYSGRCEVQVTDGLNARETEAGGAELTVSRLTVKIPVVDSAGGYLDGYDESYSPATRIRVGDLVTITAAVNDPALVDQEFRVVGLHAKTYATARRLQVERTSA